MEVSIMRFKFDSENGKRVTYFTSKLEDTAKIHRANLSDYVCTGKNEDGSYKGRHDSWAASFCGSCLEKAKSLSNGTAIILKEFSFTNYFEKDKKIAYPSITVFDFDIVEKRHKDDDNGGEPPIGGGVPSDLLTEDEGLPFD